MKIILIILILIVMADYGFRISQGGKDVKTCTDKECVITSKYSNLKGSLSGGGTFPDILNNTTRTITIAHGLSYIPFARVLIDPYGIEDFLELPYGEATGSNTLDAYYYCDATNLYIKIYQGNAFGESRVGIDYKYFIFIDKGKL
ncbi:MAG: hypothetical protein OEV44_01020 [Spirochaetota bacterium]|nr:hypothetical protein [Spirochaetota bacterium]